MSPRRSLLLVGAALGATTLGGCSYFSPQTTATPYAASDGIVAQAGQVGLRNVMVISRGKGSVGQIYGSVVNQGTAPARVAFSSGAAAPTGFTIPAGKVVNLKSTPQRLTNIPVMPGQTMPVTVTVDGAATQVNVPVLNGTLPEYRTLVPGGASSTAKATGKPSGTARPSGTATTGATGRPTSSATATASATVTKTSTGTITPKATVTG